MTKTKLCPYTNPYHLSCDKDTCDDCDMKREAEIKEQGICDQCGADRANYLEAMLEPCYHGHRSKEVI